VNVAGAWEDAADDEENVAWVRDCWRSVHRIAGRGGYVNFLTEDSGDDEREQSQAGVDLARLERVRRRYDPDGVVR
jgi:FAD/FMN-containing dehydrogenase